MRMAFTASHQSSLRSLCHVHLQARAREARLVAAAQGRICPFNKKNAATLEDDDRRFLRLLKVLRTLNDHPRNISSYRTSQGQGGLTAYYYQPFQSFPTNETSRVTRPRPSVDQPIRFFHTTSQQSLASTSSLVTTPSYREPGNKNRQLDPASQPVSDSTAEPGLEMTWERLQAESSFRQHKNTPVQKLVDLPENKYNHRLWAKLLRFRWRVYSTEGIDEIWHGLNERQTRLPGDVELNGEAETEDWEDEDIEAMDYIWALLARRLSPSQLFDYAEKQKNSGGPVYSRLYSLLMGRVATDAVENSRNFRGGGKSTGSELEEMHQDIVAQLFHCHIQFESRYYIPLSGFRLLVSQLASLGRLTEVQLLRRLYIQLRTRPVLQTTDTGELTSTYRFDLANMPALLPFLAATGFLEEASAWRAALGEETYWPARFGGPDLKTLEYNVDSHSHHFRLQVETGRRDSSEKNTERSPEDDANDDLLACLFATKAFSLETIGTGLSLLLPDIQLGPRAIREVGMRFQANPSGFGPAIRMLQQKGIQTRPSPFTTTLLRLSTSDQGDKDMFARLVAIDQDPNNFDDGNLQRRILARELQAGNILASLPIVTVMAVAVGESHPAAKAWNTVLAYQAQNRRIRSAVSIVEQMIGMGHEVSPYSTDVLEECCLGPRVGAPGTRDEFRRMPPDPLPAGIKMSSQRAAEADAKLLVGLWKRMLLSGAANRIAPVRWDGVMKRLGGLGCWSDLTALVVWLAEWHAPKTGPGISYSNQQNVCSRDRMWKPLLVSASLSGSSSYSTTSFFGVGVPTSDGDGKSASPANSEGTPPLSKDLRDIFSPALQRAIVVWGFRKGWQSALEWLDTRQVAAKQMKMREEASSSIAETTSTNSASSMDGVRTPGVELEKDVELDVSSFLKATAIPTDTKVKADDVAKITGPEAISNSQTAESKATYPEWDLIVQFEAQRKTKDEAERKQAGDDTDPSAGGGPPLPSVWGFTAGLRLLADLADRGVYIHIPAVQTSVLKVLWTMYGAGVSARSLNRKARLHAADLYRLEDVVDQVEVEMNNLRKRHQEVQSRGRNSVKASGLSSRFTPLIETGEQIRQGQQSTEVYNHLTVAKLARELATEMESQGSGFHTLLDGAIIKKRIRLVKAIFGDTPKVYANPIILEEENGPSSDGRLEGDLTESDFGINGNLGDQFEGWNIVPPGIILPEPEPFEVQYPVIPRKSRRITPALWNRAVARWAVDGKGALDLAVERELLEGVD